MIRKLYISIIFYKINTVFKTVTYIHINFEMFTPCYFNDTFCILAVLLIGISIFSFYSLYDSRHKYQEIKLVNIHSRYLLSDIISLYEILNLINHTSNIYFLTNTINFTIKPCYKQVNNFIFYINFTTCYVNGQLS